MSYLTINYLTINNIANWLNCFAGILVCWKLLIRSHPLVKLISLTSVAFFIYLAWLGGEYNPFALAMDAGKGISIISNTLFILSIIFLEYRIWKENQQKISLAQQGSLPAPRKTRTPPPDRERCKAYTKNGKGPQCKNRKAGSKYCSVHERIYRV